MSTDTGPAPDRDTGPQPTAHKISRRDAIKTGAIAAGATLTGVTAGSIRAEAGLVDGVRSAVERAAAIEGAEYAIAAHPLGGMTGVIAYRMLKDSLNTSPSADRAILHQLSTSEAETLATHEVTFSNRLQDTRPIANLEARHGIATAWEENKSASEAYDDALALIRQYYELPEFNHFHVTNKSLLQLSYIAGSGNDTDPTFDIMGSAYDSEDTFYQQRISSQRETVSITLYDGTPIDQVDPDEHDYVLEGEYETAELEVPVVEFIDDSDGSVVDTSPILTQEVVDSWDSTNEEVTYNLTNGTYTTNLRFTIPSESEDLQSERVFDGVEFFSILDEIHQQSDDVVGNYSVSFVEDLYAELDAGNITPEQVRGPDGMVRYLSNTDDPTNARWRVSMLQMFGMEQPDFSLVADMDVEWTGATGRSVDTDPNNDNRIVQPSEYVENETYSGVVFGSLVPENGFQTGNTYFVGPTAYSFGTDDMVYAYDAHTGDLRWSVDLSNGDDATSGPGFVMHPSGDYLYAFETASQGVVHAYDPETGEELWSNYVNDARFESRGQLVCNDSAVVFVSYDNFDDDPAYFWAFDAQDGSELWNTGGSGTSNFNDVDSTPDGTLIVEASNDATIFAYEFASGASEQWSTSLDVNAIGASNDLIVAANDTTVYGLDPGTGDEQWTATVSATSREVTSNSDGSLFAVGTGSDVLVLDDTGTEVETHTVGATVRALEFRSDSHLVVGSDDGVFLLRLGDGNTSESHPVHGGGVRSVTATLVGDVDGIASTALMFDESTGSEIRLSDGTLTVTEKRDAGGATIEHVDDTTLRDIEALAETPDDIATVVDEMDEFDSVDDIRYIKDVEAILDYYGSSASVGGDDADVTVQETDYERPAYDSYDSSEFASYINKLEEYLEQLEADQEETTDDGDDGWGFLGGLGDWSNGDLLGLGVIALVVMWMVGVATDLIPGLGN